MRRARSIRRFQRRVMRQILLAVSRRRPVGSDLERVLPQHLRGFEPRCPAGRPVLLGVMVSLERGDAVAIPRDECPYCISIHRSSVRRAAPGHRRTVNELPRLRLPEGAIGRRICCRLRCCAGIEGGSDEPAWLGTCTAPSSDRAPFAAHAQPVRPARIGYLSFSSPELSGYLFDAFKQGLRDLGYVEGKNVLIEGRWAMGQAERLPDLAKELVAMKPDVIAALSGPATRAMQKAMTTIPIVFASISDPIGLGFVKSLAHPGGNITGVSTQAADYSPKLLEFLLTVIAKRSRVAHSGRLRHRPCAAEKHPDRGGDGGRQPR